LCQQADEICISITELAIDVIAQDGRAENLRATLIVAMATSPAFARKGSHHHSKARLSSGRPDKRQEMAADPQSQPTSESDRLEMAADEAIAACGGDVRNALKALIVANEYLESEVCELMQAVSRAYARAEDSKPIPADTRLSRSEEHGRSDV
jgi:hypothetical protein